MMLDKKELDRQTIKMFTNMEQVFLRKIAYKINLETIPKKFNIPSEYITDASVSS